MEKNRIISLENISIAIVDDHDVVLEGYKSFFARNGIEGIETFSRAKQLIQRVCAKHFNIYIVDVELPDMDAYSLIDKIRELHPEARIIINTIHDEPWTVNKLSAKKVDGVVYKSGNLSQLIEAIESVVYGQHYFCGDFKKTKKRLDVQNDILSNREKDILRNIAQGLSTKQIAEKLFLSENTVENHRKNIFRKMHVKNVAELMIKAIAVGYIDPSDLSMV